MTDWKNTRLHLEISRRFPDGHAAQALQASMPSISSVLKSAGTQPLDFTLHDADHGFRVAEQSANLIRSKGLGELGEYELALLLFSSYLHDIGMSPGRALSGDFYTCICTGNPGALPGPKVTELQRWLDAEWSGITPPILQSPTTPEQLRKAQEVFAYFCRHKHNDWSEEWIRANVDGLGGGLYPSWIDDLVNICRSHHEGISQLRSSRFDAKLVGNPAQVVNPRFISAVLRVADVLEFDPERTPSVILEHRNIAPSSRIYWYKDQHINFALAEATQSILVSARTPSAVIHRAILTTVSDVDRELACCSTLYHEGAFRKGMIPEAERGRYDWIWPSRVSQDVREIDGRFVYIDGAFRPDHKKVLQLLSGTALYGDRLVALRELLQNATDAVREQIALERLQQDDPSDAALEEQLGRLHRIRISFGSDGENLWIKCTDDGVGMTKEVIERHLLISGSEIRGELRSLERNANSNGFSVGRTGQFGIGVLSYFMLADTVTISTRRSQEAGDWDGTGWLFITDGISSFGELTPVSRSSKGTEITLALSKEVIGDQSSAEVFERVKRYVEMTLAWLPCRIDLRDETTGSSVIDCGPGWVRTKEHFSATHGHGLVLRSERSHELTLEETEAEKRLLGNWAKLRETASNALDWFGPTEFAFADGLGRCRVWIPFYNLGADPSLGFLTLDGGNHSQLPDAADLFYARERSAKSWRGFSITDDQRAGYDRPLITELDLRAGATISVDRNKLRDMDPGVAKQLKSFKDGVAEEFLSHISSSRFSLLNRSILRKPRPAPISACSNHSWLLHHGRPEDQVARWSEIGSIVCEIQEPLYNQAQSNRGALWFGHAEVPVASLLRTHRWHNYLRLSSHVTGGRLVFYRDPRHHRPTPAILWEASNVRNEEHHWATLFPPELSEVASLRTAHQQMYNRDHPLLRSVRREDIVMPEGKIEDRLTWASLTQKNAIAFALSLMKDEARAWNALRDNAPELYRRWFQKLELDRIVYASCAYFYGNSFSVVVTAEGATQRQDLFEGGSVRLPRESLSLPSSDWWLSSSN